MKNNSTEGAILKAQLDFNLGKKFTYIELAWGFKTSDRGHGPGFWNLFLFKKQNLNERNTQHLFYKETDLKIQIIH